MVHYIRRYVIAEYVITGLYCSLYDKRPPDGNRECALNIKITIHPTELLKVGSDEDRSLMMLFNSDG